MIIVDTSIWIDHMRVTNIKVTRAIIEAQLLMHPFVVGELALGSLQQRQRTLKHLSRLEAAPVARLDEVANLIESFTLYGRGIGYIDVHLLASCLIIGNCKLLTRDRRLRETAEELGIAA